MNGLKTPEVVQAPQSSVGAGASRTTSSICDSQSQTPVVASQGAAPSASSETAASSSQEPRADGETEKSEDGAGPERISVATNQALSSSNGPTQADNVATITETPNLQIQEHQVEPVSTKCILQ